MCDHREANSVCLRVCVQPIVAGVSVYAEQSKFQDVCSSSGCKAEKWVLGRGSGVERIPITGLDARAEQSHVAD